MGQFVVTYMLQAVGQTNSPIPEMTDSHRVVQADWVMSGVIRCLIWSTTACTESHKDVLIY